MMSLPRIATFVVAAAVLLGGCGLLPALPGQATPAPTSAGGLAPPASVPLRFSLIPPQGTPEAAQISLVLLDEVTGLPYNPVLVPMERLGDGRWQVQITAPLGSLLRYRYTRIAPGAADESTTLGEPVLYRVAHVEGPVQIDDVAAAWADAPYTGPTGRILGVLADATDGHPLAEMLVSAAGMTTFSAGDGSFRLEGLPPGQHMLCAFSPDGSYQTVQQGAVVAADSTTPANLAMQPAARVQLAFEVTLPADTLPGAPIRVAGNLRQFGSVFAELPGGLLTTTGSMPTLTAVDATHAILVTSLYAGADLRYKYTLGDGLWNAERTAQGLFVTRQLIVPEQDVILQDEIVSWQAGDGGAIVFTASVPDDTPPDDLVSIQFNPFAWFDPLPMWRVGSGEWFYRLTGPLSFGDSLGYRFCRNQACGGADDVETAGPNAVGLRVTPAEVDQDLRHDVRAWQWWSGPAAETAVAAPEIIARPGFEAGVELTTAFPSAMFPSSTAAMQSLADMGANAVTFAPGWSLRQNAPLPGLSFDARYGPYLADLQAAVDAAHRFGLRANIHAVLRSPRMDLADWWSTAPRDGDWWTVWFESYRAMVLTYARAAAQAGAEKLILGGPDIRPALPGGTLANGAASGAPADAEARWRDLLRSVREVYPGRLAFEIELGADLQTPPAFLDQVDEVHVYWHAPLGSGADLSLAEMQVQAARLLDLSLLTSPRLAARPIVLNVEYLSVDGGARGCPAGPSGECLPAAAFELGRDPNPALPVDLVEQAAALNAVIAEAVSRSGVSGFYVRGYNPIVALQDKSASVFGKPAAGVLSYWYPRVTGR